MLRTLELFNIYLAAMIALLNIVGFGMVSAFTATTSSDMRKPGSRFAGLTNNQITWIASLPSITSIFGNLLSGFVSQKFGRKATLIYSSLPFVTSWVIIAYASTIEWLYAGRLIAGFCTGLFSVAVPAYIIEIATIEIRGLLGSCFQVSYTIGVLIIMVFGKFFRWPWLAVIGAMFGLSAVTFMCFMPESPPWLIFKKRYTEAVDSIRFLKGKNADTLHEYSLAAEHFSERKLFSFDQLQEPQLYKPIVLAIGLVFFQQFSGMSALMSYTVEIFEHAESSIDPSIAAVTIAGVQVLATIIGSALTDKVGRPTLCAVSGIFVTVGLIILGIHGILSKEYALSASIYGWIPLSGFIVFVASFSLGFGPIPYLMTPEFVPLEYRSVVLAVTGVFSSVFLFIITKTFDDLRYFLSDYGVYWVYGFFSLLGCLFCWICLPETKLKSINEISRSFAVKNIIKPNIQANYIDNENN